MTEQPRIQKDLREITQALKHFPDGALIEDIETALPKEHLNRRTLQRRLSHLQTKGEIYIKGQARATKYFLKDNATTTTPEARFKTPTSIALPPKAQEILDIITQPLYQRTPVSYNREFLDSYHPNTTNYLTEAEKKHLMKLGESPTKDQPAGTYAKEILNRLLIDLAWNSSRLEGNTYSLLDTQRLIISGEAANDKTTIETNMILNHKEAIEFLVESAEDIGFNRYTILNLHALLSNNLLPDPGAPGRLRSFGVGIGQSVYEPLAIPQMISEIFDEILAKAEQIENPFEQSFFIMVHLPYLQPFDDVNKRVSRLSANIPFLRNNLCPLSFVEVPDDLYIHGTLGVYELNQIELLKEVYLWAYQRSAMRYMAIQQSVTKPDPLRVKYRQHISTLIKDIIQNLKTPPMASQMIKEHAARLPTTEQSKFIEIVETELLSLHSGNFARYHVRPSEFEHWQEVWRNIMPFHQQD